MHAATVAVFVVVVVIIAVIVVVIFFVFEFDAAYAAIDEAIPSFIHPLSTGSSFSRNHLIGAAIAGAFAGDIFLQCVLKILYLSPILV